MRALPSRATPGNLGRHLTAAARSWVAAAESFVCVCVCVCVSVCVSVVYNICRLTFHCNENISSGDLYEFTRSTINAPRSHCLVLQS